MKIQTLIEVLQRYADQDGEVAIGIPAGYGYEDRLEINHLTIRWDVNSEGIYQILLVAEESEHSGVL